MSPHSVMRAFAIALGIVLGGACKGDVAEPSGTPVASVVLSTDQLTLNEGAIAVLQATALDANDQPLADRAAVWSTSDSTIAQVSNAGVVTARRPGTAQIAASVDGHSDVAQVTIAGRAVASVEVTPASPSVLRGGHLQLTARALDDSGAPLLGRQITWTSSDPTVAAVDGSGRATGITVGVATVTASVESRTAAVGVTVLAVPVAAVQLTPARDTIVLGQSTQLTATPRDSIGARLDNPVAFTSSASTIATVSSSGLVLGIAVGSATITANSGGRSATAIIVVRPRPVAAVIVSPAQSALTVGQTLRLTVQTTDGNGNVLTGRPASFSSSNANIASVAANGTVTALAPGTATITVTSEGKTGTASVTVALSPIATLSVSPTTATLLVGATRQLVATARDAGGTVLTQRTITWMTGAPSVVSVSASGLVTAVGPGVALVFASAEGRLASATITVTTPAPSTVTVSPASATVIVGQTRDLVATLRDGAGQIVTGRTVQWVSTNSATAVVSSAGRVRGVAPGLARIDAIVDGVTGSSAVTVVPVPVATVSVSLAPTSAIVGQTSQATAVTRDSAGGVLNGRTVTWSSSNAAVATVSTTGVVTATARGTANIIATSEGKSAQATFSVVVGPPAMIAAVSVVTQSATVLTAVTAPPSVKVTDAGGSPVSGVTVILTRTAGGGVIVPATPASVVTNAQGIASLTSWTLGVLPGVNTVTATRSGLSGSPVTFNATGTVGAATTITANSVVAQSATVSSAVAAPPSVKVTDLLGNPVGGVVVVFTRTVGTGVIVPATPASVTTSANGIATLTRWTLGATPGANRVTAAVTGLLGSPVTFNATATAR